MARFRVTETSFINGRLISTEDVPTPGGGFQPPDPQTLEIEFDGIPGTNLEPLDDEAHAAVAKAVEEGFR